MSLLEVESVVARHGSLTAVRNVSLAVDEGATLALVGANGAGKTTLLRVIAGAHVPNEGRVRLDGVDITGLGAHKRVRLGVALVPEGRRLFPDLTVEENLLTARGKGLPGPWTVETVFDAFPILRPLARRRASALSGGEQQATAIGRALMCNPRLLLLDEVSLGLSPIAVDAVYASLQSLIAAGGATVVIVEQDLRRAMAVAGQITCMLEGRIVLSGAAGTLSREEITAAYFGLGRTPTGTS
jgi:branched-chain amino acid transport system ATP-binding protein